jgi:hypothetical protein
MDIANRFADGKVACHNKRTRSPEDDRGNRCSNQRRRFRNYDNYGSRSQVVAGYKESNYQGYDHKNTGYRNNSREDSSSNRQFQPRGSREYNVLIRCKRIYNFWCSMLVLHQLLYVLFTLCGIFMHFLELTYWQDATVPVLVFCYFSIPDYYWRKCSWNWTKQ